MGDDLPRVARSEPDLPTSQPLGWYDVILLGLSKWLVQGDDHRKNPGDGVAVRSRVQVPDESGVTLVNVCQGKRRSVVNWRV
jgi:hypothetical protein